MSKKLLEESTIRQFMKLASLEPLSEAFFEEGRKGKDMREEDMREELSDEEKKKVAAAADKAAAPIEKGMKGTGKPVKEEMGDFDPITQELPVDIPDDTTNTDDMAMMEEELDALFEEEHMSEMGMREEDEDMEMEVEEGDMEAEINITPDQARAIIAVADMLKDIMPDLEEPEMEDEEEMDMDMEEPEMEAEEEEEIETPEGEEEEEETEELAESILRNVTARLRELKNK
jgi:hypothetical protein